MPPESSVFTDKNGFLSDEQIGNILKNSDENNDEEFLMLETEETIEDNVSVHSDEEDVITGSDDDDVLSQGNAQEERMATSGHLLHHLRNTLSVILLASRELRSNYGKYS
ncbi:hypothetical protein EVAR_90899_1 [Eumeta japonica]|uniref:Uncharacterized protein n=1 Tax=Eumeta variegata TaxID=151549 RepID=A0A4C2A3Z6_EUMVA|nr:hypothetical protein EVAR_90899_1 [Eumeta japonica]